MLLIFLLSACTDARRLANSEQDDTTDTLVVGGREAYLKSAFYGLDDEIPSLASLFSCNGVGGGDGMPVVFSLEVALESLQAGDFRVTLDDDSIGAIKCVTPAPASDQGELRTILLLGDLGSIYNQPFEVEIVGNILSLDGRRKFLGSNVRVTRLEQGPEIVHADIVPEVQWELGKQASIFPFGGGSGCPPSTQQVIRVTWTGGITKFGGGEVDQTEQSAYRILVEGDDGQLMRIEPFAMGDLGDGDNNHKLCLDTRSRPLGVEFPEGLVTDPREDFNPATSIELP